jgi:hypothetical protein
MWFVLTQGLGVLWMITRGANRPEGAKIAEAIAAVAKDSGA